MDLNDFRKTAAMHRLDGLSTPAVTHRSLDRKHTHAIYLSISTDPVLLLVKTNYPPLTGFVYQSSVSELFQVNSIFKSNLLGFEKHVF